MDGKRVCSYATYRFEKQGGPGRLLATGSSLYVKSKNDLSNMVE